MKRTQRADRMFKKTVALGGRLTKSSLVRVSLQCLFGGVGYGLIEVIWRGYTHPSMVITGGFCFAMICAFNRKLAGRPLFFRSVACTLGVTLAEFCVGMLVNRVFQMDVWDYSGEWMHLLGQICPLYTGFWFGICFSLSFILQRLRLSVISLNLQK